MLERDTSERLLEVHQGFLFQVAGLTPENDFSVDALAQINAAVNEASLLVTRRFASLPGLSTTVLVEGEPVEQRVCEPANEFPKAVVVDGKTAYGIWFIAESEVPAAVVTTLFECCRQAFAEACAPYALSFEFICARVTHHVVVNRSHDFDPRDFSKHVKGAFVRMSYNELGVICQRDDEDGLSSYCGPGSDRQLVVDCSEGYVHGRQSEAQVVSLPVQVEAWLRDGENVSGMLTETNVNDHGHAHLVINDRSIWIRAVETLRLAPPNGRVLGNPVRSTRPHLVVSAGDQQ